MERKIWQRDCCKTVGEILQMIKNFLQELDYENGYKKAVIDITKLINMDIEEEQM